VAGRYEVSLDGDLALLAYQWEGDHTIAYLHTEVPEALAGRGVGSALARAALEDARTRGLTVVPYCPFVSAYLRRHREYLSLVSSAFRERLADGES
jgi:predicted GNAT family acetyltransferase